MCFVYIKFGGYTCTDHAIRILKTLFDLKSVHFALFTHFFNDQNFFWTKIAVSVYSFLMDICFFLKLTESMECYFLSFFPK